MQSTPQNVAVIADAFTANLTREGEQKRNPSQMKDQKGEKFPLMKKWN